VQLVVEARGIHKHFGALHVLKGVDLAVRERELVFVIGPSGSGKSTLLRCLNRLEQPSSGSLVVDGVDLLDPRTDINRARQRIGMVFQSFNLYPHLDALGNVTLALRKVVGQSRAEAELAGQAALERVGLAEKAGRLPNELSGGEQQRVSIARAVVNHPPLLICDEPTGNLDPDTSVGIMQLLHRINTAGTTILMVTHDREMVDKMRKRVIALDQGKLMRDERRGGYETE